MFFGLFRAVKHFQSAGRSSIEEKDSETIFGGLSPNFGVLFPKPRIGPVAPFASGLESDRYFQSTNRRSELRTEKHDET